MAFGERAPLPIGPLRVGVAEVEYKPALGLMLGDAAPVALGYRTPLFIKALVFNNGFDEVAVVAADLINFDRRDVAKVAAKAHERCGIRPDAILLTCSHSHVSPASNRRSILYQATFNASFSQEKWEKQLAFIDGMVDTIADAICEAKANLQPGSLGVVTADLPWLIFNRRRYTRNYHAWTHWMKIPPNQAYDVEGPIDPELGLFVARDAQHRPLAMLWNFSGHNSFYFDDQYSADISYTVQAMLDERLGMHVPTLYAPGCGGNTNYFDYGQPGGLEKATEGVASAIVAIYREACTLPEVKLAGTKVSLFFPPRDNTRYWWKNDISHKLPSWITFGERGMKNAQEMAKEQGAYQTEVTVLRLGEVALVGLPGEIFVEFGLMLKERSPFRRTFVTSYTNDGAGYIPTRRAFLGGSYEAWHTSSPTGREAGYKMVDKAVELLTEFAG